MDKGLLTTAQAAKRLKRSRRWVQDIILRGKLKAERVGGAYVVRARDVDRYRHQLPGRPSRARVRIVSVSEKGLR